jgi:hypothetical protein
MNKIEEHERELKEVTSRLEDVQGRIAVLRQEEEGLVAGKRAWEAIVAMEKKQYPMTTVEPSVVVTAMDSASQSGHGGETDDISNYDDVEEEGENKTQFVRDFMQKNATYGVTANDLKAAAAAAGMQHPPSWPYGPFQRLKKKGEIVKRRGRFYPASKTAGGARNLALVG